MNQIQHSWIMVSLESSCWRGTRTDRNLAGVAADSVNARRSTVSANKNLLSAAKGHIDAIAAVQQKGAAWLRTHGLPWTRGHWLLKAYKLLEAQTEFSALEGELRAAVDALAQNWAGVVAVSRAQLGDADPGPDAYPDVSTLHTIYRTRIRFMPIPHSAQFQHLGLPREAVEELERQHKQDLTDQMAAATDQVLERAAECARRLHDVMSKKLRGESTRFHVSVLAEAEAVATLLTALDAVRFAPLIAQLRSIAAAGAAQAETAGGQAAAVQAATAVAAAIEGLTTVPEIDYDSIGDLATI